jgi:hypothetical protein
MSYLGHAYLPTPKRARAHRRPRSGAAGSHKTGQTKVPRKRFGPRPDDQLANGANFPQSTPVPAKRPSVQLTSTPARPSPSISQQTTWGRQGPRVQLAWSLASALAFFFPFDAGATNLIRRPGSHNAYSFEIEPHLNVYGFGSHDNADVGVGVRASIPFMHNGPIRSINNNLAISFGVDTYFPKGAFGVSLPVAAQWNFYFTEIISVLGEVGIIGNFGNYAPSFNVLDPYIQGGGRFQFGKVGVLVRIGYPSFSVGANFQF